MSLPQHLSPQHLSCYTATLQPATATTAERGRKPFWGKDEQDRIIHLLEDAPLFNGLAQSEIARFVHGVREQSLEKGSILFHKGDPCRGFHLVLSGQIKLAFVSTNGHEKVVEVVGSGQTFGEAVMFMDKPYVVTAQALTTCTLLHIAKQVVFDEMARDPAFSRKIVAGLSMRLHRLISDVEAYSLRSARERIIGYLLNECAGDNNEVRCGAVSIQLQTSKGVIASRLNLTQEHFSRILHELMSAGLIIGEGRTIHIPDIEQLRRNLE